MKALKALNGEQSSVSVLVTILLINCHAIVRLPHRWGARASWLEFNHYSLCCTNYILVTNTQRCHLRPCCLLWRSVIHYNLFTAIYGSAQLADVTKTIFIIIITIIKI